MAITILMPSLSPTMTDGTLARWLVKEGDKVQTGDVIAEIETDKATMEIESLDDGIMAKIIIADGTQKVPINEALAIIAEEGEDVDAAIKAATASMPAPLQPEKNSAKAEKMPISSPLAPSGAAGSDSATPAKSAQMPAMPAMPGKAAQMPATSNSASPKSGISKSTSPESAKMPISALNLGEGGRVFASPLARRIAADKAIDLSLIKGTGPHGRIIRADVEEALAAGISAVTSPSQMADSSSQMERFVPHNAMRRVIAERLQYSKQSAPHFYLTVDCEIDTLLSARKAMNGIVEEGVKISVNDMVVKAAAFALIAVPDVNGYFEPEGCRYFSQADICMAVAVEGGLVTPVIRGANNLGLTSIAKTSADLALRARNGQLDPAEYAGGTFTISNLGMFGIREFAGVINPPQGAILAVGAGEKRPVVKADELAIATVMSVTLSADHRIVDGALGALWLQAFKQAIENPVTMLL